MDLKNFTFENNKTFVIKGKEFIAKYIGENEESFSSKNFNTEMKDFVIPMFREYVQYLSNFGVELSFQDFEKELSELPGVYSNYKRGKILVVILKEKEKYSPVGIVGLKDLGNEISEMKRLYVNENFRGFGLGKILMDEIINCAKKLNYRFMRWDTLKKLKNAGKLYDRYQCKLIDSYNFNPYDDVLYYEMNL